MIRSSHGRSAPLAGRECCCGSSERGHVRAGDSVVVEQVPAHDVTVSMVFAMYLGDAVDVGAVLAAPGLAAHWQDWRGHRTVWHLDEERKRAAEDAQSQAAP